MAQASSYNTVGNKEDIMSTITILEPEATPLVSMAKKGKASGTFFEWQADSLLSPDFSGVNEGEDVSSCTCLLYTSPSPRDGLLSRMPSSA